ncbi:response regulator transcription factor [Magnetospirillum sulfuroxidans]|uniref:Response regulator transcription factor n=1 Tax=Magnetospirillum sulfuroxidans TaxID=611300 RepID=A0ABS5IDF3_9PROT|nr:response regulator [Magnetospirillum sulfuroxidans]MBR9972445.1 response regulator transcription factor [Magnetospirillum sulfuroxidans]
MTEAPFVVAVVDDDASFREAIVWLLRTNGYDARPYGDADNFIAQHDIRAIGCALVDLRLGEDCGIEVFRRSRAHGHDMPVIMISGHGDIPTAVKAVQQGAMGFIEKPIDNAKLLVDVASACAHHRDFCARYGRAVEAMRLYDLLTAREREVFWLLVNGKATKEVAADLGINLKTAEVHRSAVLKKMRANSVAEIICKSMALHK